MAEAFAALIGLGNPGPEYVDSRHNAGFWFVERAAERFGCPWRHEPKLSAIAGRACVEGVNIWLIKPLTFMNASGTTVRSLCRYYRLAITQVLVVHDELDLAPGVVRLKRGGGAGGHNGLSDIIAEMGADFWRLRLGIGRPAPRRDLVPYVLGRPPQSEREAIEAALLRGLDMLPLIVKGESERAMNLLHRTDGEASHGA
ncbi:MAG TPA: aminoacyl-tRNA hydrolase [Acidiferrobacter sp.]|nr:aminoacyl-tRNA hydrolase [Acidiferrobacter sp.]